MRFADLHKGRASSRGDERSLSRRFSNSPGTTIGNGFISTRYVRGRWGGLIASGWMTCSIAMELAVGAVLADSESIGSPGVESLKWLNPVRPGDELRLQ